MVSAALVQGRGILQARTTTTGVTCDSQYSWMNNTQGQSPCLLAAVLSAPCGSGGNWNVPALNSSQQYNPPNTSSANYCVCSWAVYNLLGACTVCQGNKNIDNWSYFINGCGNYITSSPFPTDKITVSNGVLLPYWAGTDPSTWTNQLFDVNQAQSINSQNHSDINLAKLTSSNKKSGTSTGGIAGGVIAAVVVILLGAVAIFCYMRRRQRVMGRRKALLDPLPETGHPTLHGRSLSDMSQMTAVGPATYSNNMQVVPPVRPYTPNGHTSPGLQTSFSPSNHSLPYDVSLIGSIGLGTPSPPPRPSAARTSTLPGVTEAPVEGPENIIVPFTLPASSLTSDRKRPDGGVYPIYEEPNAGPSRRRLNPPTYSESVNLDSGESSVLGSQSSPTQSIDRKGRSHLHQNSADSTNSASNMYSDTASLRTHLPPGSVVGLDDVVSQLGFGAPSVVGVGSAAMTSNRGARRSTLPASEGSVLNADEIA